jgi:hypothetical protein
MRLSHDARRAVRLEFDLAYIRARRNAQFVIKIKERHLQQSVAGDEFFRQGLGGNVYRAFDRRSYLQPEIVVAVARQG